MMPYEEPIHSTGGLSTGQGSLVFHPICTKLTPSYLVGAIESPTLAALIGRRGETVAKDNRMAGF